MRRLFNSHTNMTSFSLFCTPIWPPWRHVKTIYSSCNINKLARKTGVFCSAIHNFFFFWEWCYPAILHVKTTRELGRVKNWFQGRAFFAFQDCCRDQCTSRFPLKNACSAGYQKTYWLKISRSQIYVLSWGQLGLVSVLNSSPWNYL